MNLENIKRIVAEYDELNLLVRNFVDEIREYDSFYTASYEWVESFEIEVDKNLLSFTLDDSYSSYTEYKSYGLPLNLLVLSGNELKTQILKLKVERELEKIRKDEEYLLKQKLILEENERILYETLKAKFK